MRKTKIAIVIIAAVLLESFFVSYSNKMNSATDFSEITTKRYHSPDGTIVIIEEKTPYKAS
jgi:hypothetical protein